MSDTIKPVAWAYKPNKIGWGEDLDRAPIASMGDAGGNEYWLPDYPLYTADALRQARDDALEEAAKFSDDVYERSASRDDGEDKFEDGIKWAASTIATKIRALKEKK